MDVLIIGGGLLGLSTAQGLQEQGAQVTLLDGREGVGLETSRANGGLLTASMSDPWNAPGVPRHLAASLFGRHSAMKLHPRAAPSLFLWGFSFLANSRAERYREATLANYQLAACSIRQTRKLRERLGLNYEASDSGALKLFRDEAAMAGPLALAERLAACGLRYERLDADGAVAREPRLGPVGDRIAGALFFPEDAVGDAYLFCRELARRVVEQGARVRTGAAVRRLVVLNGRVQGVETHQGVERANHVVVAAGSSSEALLKTAGLTLPVRPVKGYSLTVRVEEEERPGIPVIDDQLHAVVAPLGQRLRVAGTAEFTGHDAGICRERIDNLYSLLQAVYPRIAARVDRASAEPWAGLRPVSCDGKPFIGPTPVKGLYVNTGHGHLGWTMAVGSARLLSELIAGRPAAIDPTPYRFGR